MRLRVGIPLASALLTQPGFAFDAHTSPAADRLELTALLFAVLALALSIAVCARNWREHSSLSAILFFAALAFLPASTLWCLADASRAASRWRTRAADLDEARSSACEDRLTWMAAQLGAYTLSTDTSVSAELIAANRALIGGGGPRALDAHDDFAKRGLGRAISPRLAREHIGAASALLDGLAAEPVVHGVSRAYTDVAGKLAARSREIAARLPDSEASPRPRAHRRSGAPFRAERKLLAQVLREARTLGEVILTRISSATRETLASARDLPPGPGPAEWLWLAHALLAVSLGSRQREPLAAPFSANRVRHSSATR